MLSNIAKIVITAVSTPAIAIAIAIAPAHAGGLDPLGSACGSSVPVGLGLQSNNISAAVASVSGPGGTADSAALTTMAGKDLSVVVNSSSGEYGAGATASATIADPTLMVVVYPGYPGGYQASAE
jgi:hypothetical protein